MKITEAKVGARVRSTVALAGVPTGTEGVIDDDYGTGFMVAWDLPERPLPERWRYAGQAAITPGVPLRDGFDKQTELHLLTLV